MSKHGADHNEQNPLDTMERNDTRTPQEVLESAEAVKARLRHSEVEGLVARYADALPCIDSYCDNNGVTVIAGSDGNPEQAQCEYCYRERFPAIENFRALLTSHGAKERGEGFNEGMKAVRCQTAEEAYERGRGEGARQEAEQIAVTVRFYLERDDTERALKYVQRFIINEALPQTDVTKN